VRRGVDVVIALDTSLSMSARDVAPDRFGLSRQAARALLGRLEGDRVGLVTFAGRGALECPLTSDLAAVRLFLDAASLEAAPVPGTALAEAVRASLRALAPAGAEGSRSRAIVLLSDGEDHEGGVEVAVTELRRADVTVFSVGVGTEVGAPIPTGDGTGYKRDQDGTIVTTRLGGSSLRRLASETGGLHVVATPAGDEIADVARALSRLEAGDAEAVLRTRYEERFQIPLVLAAAALVAELLMAETRRSRAPRGA
jgi:Ca-activated chloride channel family protein